MSVQALVQINGGTRDFVGKTRRSGILAAPIWMFIYQPRFEFEFSRFQSFLREIVRGDLLSTIISEFSWIWKFLFNFSYTRFVSLDLLQMIFNARHAFYWKYNSRTKFDSINLKRNYELLFFYNYIQSTLIFHTQFMF